MLNGLDIAPELAAVSFSTLTKVTQSGELDLDRKEYVMHNPGIMPWLA